MSIRVIQPLDSGQPVPEERYLVYLDKLREVGVTNMFGAAPYLTTEFPELDLPDARHVLGYWMQTFAIRHGHIEEA